MNLRPWTLSCFLVKLVRPVRFELANSWRNNQDWQDYQIYVLGISTASVVLPRYCSKVMNPSTCRKHSQPLELTQETDRFTASWSFGSILSRLGKLFSRYVDTASWFQHTCIGHSSQRTQNPAFCDSWMDLSIVDRFPLSRVPLRGGSFFFTDSGSSVG